MLLLACMVGVAGAAVPECAQSGVGYKSALLTVNGGFPVDASACQALCAQRADCAFFTFYTESHGCWLQDSDAQIGLDHPQAVSGPKVCPTTPTGSNTTSQKKSSSVNVTETSTSFNGTPENTTQIMTDAAAANESANAAPAIPAGIEESLEEAERTVANLRRYEASNSIQSLGAPDKGMPWWSWVLGGLAVLYLGVSAHIIGCMGMGGVNVKQKSAPKKKLLGQDAQDRGLRGSEFGFQPLVQVQEGVQTNAASIGARDASSSQPLQQQRSQVQIDDLFNQLDTDGDGVLSPEELSRLSAYNIT